VAEKENDLPASLPADALRRKLATLERAIGEAALLMMHHPAYRYRHLGDLRRLVLPPVLLNQYKFVRDRKDRTIGFVAWAPVSDKVRSRLLEGHLALRLPEWSGGEHIVIMAAIAPTPSIQQKILREMAKTEFSGKEVWHARSGAAIEPNSVAQAGADGILSGNTRHSQ